VREPRTELPAKLLPSVKRDLGKFRGRWIAAKSRGLTVHGRRCVAKLRGLSPLRGLLYGLLRGLFAPLCAVCCSGGGGLLQRQDLDL
jgi:hypothetical protein